MLASASSVLLIDFFLRASDFAQHSFKSSISGSPEMALLISPLIFLLVVTITKNYCHFVQGSGIPQAIAATQSNNKLIRDKLLSFRVAIGKIAFIFFGMLGGGSIGIEGPSIHIGSSIFYGFNRFIKQKRKLFLHAIIAIGGSAGLIVAFNAPIAGFLFAYEELGRNLKRQLFFLVGLFSLLTYFFSYLYRGNDFYLVDLTNLSTDFLMVWILLPLVLVSGVLGGFFSKSAIYLLKRFRINSFKKIILYSVGFGFLVGIMNFLSSGLIAGSGRDEVILLLNQNYLGIDFLIEKYLATLFSLASTIPGGLFMPTIAIGGSLGSELSHLIPLIAPASVIVITMICYLSAVIRAPLTSTFVIIEMTGCYELLLPGLVFAFLSALISKKIQQKPIYEALAEQFALMSKKV